jgi:hypothetical protein
VSRNDERFAVPFETVNRDRDVEVRIILVELNGRSTAASSCAEQDPEVPMIDPVATRGVLPETPTIKPVVVQE